MRLRFMLFHTVILAAVPTAGSADQPRTVTPGGYRAGLTKLLRVDPSLPIWGPGIETPEPGGEFAPDLRSSSKASRRASAVAQSGGSHPRQPKPVATDRRTGTSLPSPGGYRPGLTKLLRVDAASVIWGPGIKTPAPGGEILAPLRQGKRHR